MILFFYIFFSQYLVIISYIKEHGRIPESFIKIIP